MLETHSSTQSQESPGISIMPPTILLVCLVAGALLEILLPSSLALPWQFWRIVLGGVIGYAGFTFMMRGHGLFQQRGTNIRTNRPATELVTSGTYQYSRNPMYVGMCGSVFGLALIVGSAWLLAATFVLWLYFALYVVPREERYMLRTFGQAYATYQSEVRRWL